MEVTRPRVLIVEDDADLRLVLVHTLRTGADVTACPDGYQALQLLRSEHFDALLLDLLLPGVQGDGLLERMRAEAIDVPVVVLTALVGHELTRRAEALGAVVLTKPFESTALRDAILRCASGPSALGAGELV